MKNQLKKTLISLMVILFCLTNTVFAQSEDDFFEFVVVDEQEITEDVETDLNTEEEGEFVTTSVDESNEAANTIETTEKTTAETTVEETTTVESTAVETAIVETPIVETEIVETAIVEPIEDSSVSNTAVLSDNSVTSVETNEPAVSSYAQTSNPVETTVPEINTEPVGQEDLEEESTEETPVDEKAPSRTITINKKQYLEVTYPGEGWLYMGDENNSKSLSFKGREQKGNYTLMKFYSDRAGEALLHFCKQDIIMNTYIHDYLLVIIDKKSGNKEHIQAPEYIPPAIGYDLEDGDDTSLSSEDVIDDSNGEIEITQEDIEEDTDEDKDIIIGGVSLADEPDVVFSFGSGIDFFGEDSDDDYYQTLIDEANDAFFSGRGQEAIDKAQIVIDDGSYFSDEAYYIQAQVYETNQAMLDVNKAYDLYKIIVSYYPESSFWTKASKRVTYLERYYFQIR